MPEQCFKENAPNSFIDSFLDEMINMIWPDFSLTKIKKDSDSWLQRLFRCGRVSGSERKQSGEMYRCEEIFRPPGTTSFPGKEKQESLGYHVSGERRVYVEFASAVISKGKKSFKGDYCSSVYVNL